jgi:hypothetical protein
LFDYAFTSLRTERIALLLVDEISKAFTPWALNGFDQTTGRRLRIPSDIITIKEMLISDTPVVLSGTETDFLQPYFSVREFSILSQFIYCPLVHENNLIAFILIAMSEDEDGFIDALIENLTLFSQFGGKLIYEGRNKLSIGDKDDTAQISLVDAQDHIARMIQLAIPRDESLFLYKISIPDMITNLHAFSNNAEEYRLQEDILSILNVMIGSAGMIIRYEPNYAVIALISRSVHDENFLLHHVLLTLSDFGITSGLIHNSVVGTKRFPQDGSTAEGLLDSL